MIKNIILDFGDIFINLDKQATAREMMKFGFEGITPALESLFQTYEKGLITSTAFIADVNTTFPKANPQQLINAWNAILLDFPENRLEFIEALAAENRYRLFLLSNTNAIHIEQVKKQMGIKNYNRFKNCFEQFYLSYEIFLRKPDTDIYQFVLDENKLNPSETIFVDDTKENTDSALKLGINVWHLKVGKEDIIDLKFKL
ncbi:MAG: haloacid dehalogenase [Flavobacteriaceae bacterium]|nr:MAG: haloacid dehalogenase [Flavobacteriaceae bacterium]